MGRRKARNMGEAAKLEMTPMIDVVFQLLIFFIVTLKEQDILANLNISRPAPDPRDKPPPVVDEMLTIEVGNTGWVVNGRPYAGESGFRHLDRDLMRLTSVSKEMTVVIKCTGNSQHYRLIQVLNILSRQGMKNISVFSL
jgi:biopolymer transport protein ExbD